MPAALVIYMVLKKKQLLFIGVEPCFYTDGKNGVLSSVPEIIGINHGDAVPRAEALKAAV